MVLVNGSSGSICLIVPCFNEELRFKLEYWKAVLSIPGIYLVFVDDGSQDQTSKVFNQLSSHENCEIITLERNFGKANAIRHGMKQIMEGTRVDEYDVFGFLDADGAFNPSEIARFFNLLKSESLSTFASIWSSRVQLSGRNIERNKYRHYIGRLISSIITFKRRYIAYDTQSGLKLFRKSEVLQSALSEPFLTRWFFDIELFSRLTKMDPKFRVYEEPLDYWVDIKGSKINWRQWLKILLEIKKIRRVLNGF